MKTKVNCPVCADGYLIPDGDTDYCSSCGTVFKTVPMKIITELTLHQQPANLVEPPPLAVVKEDGTRETFPKATTEQVRQSLEEKYKVRKRHDIKELVANTDPAFLKDVWEEQYGECYKCASETKYGCEVVCTCKPAPEVTQFDRAEALDRIHVIQTMICELLWMWEGSYPAHKGLSELAAYHVQEAMDDLAKAYQSQGLHVFVDADDAS